MSSDDTDSPSGPPSPRRTSLSPTSSPPLRRQSTELSPMPSPPPLRRQSAELSPMTSPPLLRRQSAELSPAPASSSSIEHDAHRLATTRRAYIAAQHSGDRTRMQELAPDLGITVHESKSTEEPELRPDLAAFRSAFLASRGSRPLMQEGSPVTSPVVSPTVSPLPSPTTSPVASPLVSPAASPVVSRRNSSADE